jgi:hypothetical protein
MQKLVIIATLLAIAVAITIAPTAYVTVNAQTTGGSVAGSETGAAAAAVTKTVELNNDKILTVLWTASGGNFGSKFGLVSVSVDNSAFILVDNVSLSTNTKVGKYYSDSTKATTVAINPATFPFVKLQTSAGNTGVTETITWQAIR